MLSTANDAGAYWTEVNGTWNTTASELWSSTNGDFFEDYYPSQSLSCTAPGDCSAVGVTAVQASLTMQQSIPNRTAMGFPLCRDRFSQQFLFLVAINCADASDGTVVGQESLGGFSFVGVVVTESDGLWSSTPLQIAGTYTLDGVSCPDAVDCTAVGHDDPVEGSNPTYYPVYVTESSGSWGSGTEIDTTGEGYFNAVSCVDATDCVAVGDDGQDIYAVESDGTWGPDIEASSDEFDTNSGFTDVSCVSTFDCTAVEFLGPTSTSNTPSVIVTSNSPVYNQTLTFTTVTGTNASKPKGSVTWSVSDPQTVSCSTTTGPINSGNVATYSCSVRHVSDGTYSATAQFNGDKIYAAAIGS